MSLAILALAALSLAPQSTWVVSSSGGIGVDFADLPPAVAAAAHGDTILVRTGSYSGFQASGKALTIRGPGNLLPLVSGNTTVIDAVPAGAVFFVDGLRFQPTLGSGFVEGMRVQAGSLVALANCQVQGANYVENQRLAGPGLIVRNAQVFAARSVVTGGQFQGFLAGFGGAGSGVVVENGALFASDCTITGGSQSVQKRTGHGGHGLAITGGSAALFDTAVTGGSGSGVGPGSTAGDGIALLSSTSFARVAGNAGTIVRPGLGQVPGFAIRAALGGAVVHGPVTLQPGAGLSATSGNVTIGAPVLPHLTITGTATLNGEIQPDTAVVVGIDRCAPNAPMVLGLGAQPFVSTFLYPRLVEGEVLLRSQEFALAAALGGGGAFTQVLPLGVPPSMRGVPLFTQVAVLDLTANRILLSNPELRLFRH